MWREIILLKDTGWQHKGGITLCKTSFSFFTMLEDASFPEETYP